MTELGYTSGGINYHENGTMTADLYPTIVTGPLYVTSNGKIHMIVYRRALYTLQGLGRLLVDSLELPLLLLRLTCAALGPNIGHPKHVWVW